MQWQAIIVLYYLKGLIKMSKKRRKSQSRRTTKEKTVSPIPTSDPENFTWDVSQIDEDGRWGWNKIKCSYFLKNVWGKMREFERKKWSEVLGGDHRWNHKIAVTELTSDAQKRLKQLNYDDVGELISLRVTGKQRIWAIHIEQTAFVLWWDPKHEVRPTPLKHT